MTLKFPDYSVVIPAFNAGNFIGQTIQSVLDQTHPPVKIVVVDDGSSDNLAKALTDYEAQITLIRQANQGPATATALGFQSVKTDYVATTDADDIWHADKIEKQFLTLEKMPDIDIIFSQMDSFGEDIATAKINSEHAGWSRTTMLLHRSAYDRVGPFEDMPGRRGEMVDWIAQARSMNIGIHMLEEVLASRRIHKGSLSWGRNPDQDRGYMEAVLRALKRRKESQNK
ncbi:MAG: glycosyltransferase family 2 protein [Rhodobacteraceae bacterium]|nr:glycosyltransferase family 2 protein [Paracoccaceae bacterium]